MCLSLRLLREAPQGGEEVAVGLLLFSVGSDSDICLRRWRRSRRLPPGTPRRARRSSRPSARSATRSRRAPATSKVQISLQNQRVPAGVGMASDPMVARRSGRKLPMEDISFCQCPLQGVEHFGLFGIFDGHGGDGAAKAVSKILPENLGYILSHPETNERVQSCSDASDVLRYAFTLTEDAIDHQYEGCTGTALLIWFDQNKDCFAQCANLGDSACVMSVNGKTIDMTEDHRVASATERARIARTGQPLKDGEVRLNGLNLARMFGDKFLKEQDSRFSSEPYVSQAVRITKACTAFAIIASDGLWDVISTKKAVQLVVEGKERNSGDSTSAAKVANRVLNEARNLRTKDNTSVIFVDFDILRTDPCIAK